MSAVRVFYGLWKNRIETSDRAKDQKLKTRYYKLTKKQMVEKINFVIRNKLPGWKVTHLDLDRGEMLVEKKGTLRDSEIVITVIQVEPFRSAVDVVSALKGPIGDLGASYFTILEFFKALDQENKPV